MNTKAAVVIAALAGGVLAVLAFLLADRWLMRPGPAPWPFRPSPTTEAEFIADTRLQRARMDCGTLLQIVEIFQLQNDRLPAHLEELTGPQPKGGKPLCDPEKLTDPWGGRYRMEAVGGRVRVWAKASGGEVVSAEKEIGP